MKLRKLLIESVAKLKEKCIEDSNLKVKILIEYIFDISKERIILNEEKELTQNEILKFNTFLEKIESGVPIQYIINKQEFMGINFFVNEDVLIPQPDTEILVEEVIKYCKKFKSKKIKVLDLCTGSGAIAISICKYLNNIEMYATDISEEAIKVANKNAKKNYANINFINSDMFQNIKEEKFDIIVSNPPYIESRKIKTLSREVKNEPIIALDGGEDGLKFYKIIAKEISQYIKEDGAVFLEIGYNQKNEVIRIFNNFNNINCVKDLGGNDRVLIIQK